MQYEQNIPEQNERYFSSKDYEIWLKLCHYQPLSEEDWQWIRNRKK